MSSLAFLFALIGMVIIVRWAVANDRAGDSGSTTGLLAMKDPQAAPAPVVAGGRQGRGRAEHSARRSTPDAPSRAPAEAPRSEPAPDWTLGDAVGADFSIAQVRPSGPSAAAAAADETSDAGTTPPAPRGSAPARRRRSR